jgi:hypothetical protein
MKLLYVDIFAEALNPTGTLTPLLFRTVDAQTVFYGPGFTSRSVLKRGLIEFIDEFGPFDAIVLGPNSPLLTPVDNPAEFTARRLGVYNAWTPEPAVIEMFVRDLFQNLNRVKAVKFLSTLNLDAYACSQWHIDQIEAFNLHLIGPNHQFYVKTADLPDYAKQERHYRRKAHIIGDYYLNFALAHPERIVTAVHFVAETEINLRHTDERRHSINVPGVRYNRRAKALEALSKAKMSRGSNHIFHLYRLLGRLGFRVFGHHLSLTIYQAAFAGGLVDSRMVYTARGGFGLPIRKFFEIPAAGAMMICTPPYGFRDLGFRDGDNCIIVEPEALPSVVEEFMGQPERVAEIARRGQDLIFREHSLAARARQIATCIQQIIAGAYRGAEWIDGRFTPLVGQASVSGPIEAVGRR